MVEFTYKTITVEQLEQFNIDNPDYNYGPTDQNGKVRIMYNGVSVRAPLSDWVNDDRYFDDVGDDCEYGCTPNEDGECY